jgi:CDP-diacylglycerol--glycerol-3-phosphate 3-phosphatidyltransferase/cardiolipin synthase
MRSSILNPELARLPNVLSLLRVPLAAAFPFTIGSPALALSVLAASGLTDVLDGFVARWTGETTVTGAILDPIADKVFVTTVGVTLLAHDLLPLWGLAPLLAREILEAPLALLTVSSRARRGARVPEARANLPGKLATFTQFAAIASAIAAPGALRPLLVLAGVAGIAAGLSYGARELRAPIVARGRVQGAEEQRPRGA